MIQSLNQSLWIVSMCLIIRHDEFLCDECLLSLLLSDEDMQSLASLMSVKPTDIGNLDDFNESDEDEDKKSVTATGGQTNADSAPSLSSSLRISSAHFFLPFPLPLPLLLFPLLFSLLAAAVVPHTLTRPNRPAPPPPDKRNSTGATFPASGSFLSLSCSLYTLTGKTRCEQELSLSLFVIRSLSLYYSISHIHVICSAVPSHMTRQLLLTKFFAYHIQYFSSRH